MSETFTRKCSIISRNLCNLGYYVKEILSSGRSAEIFHKRTAEVYVSIRKQSIKNFLHVSIRLYNYVRRYPMTGTYNQVSVYSHCIREAQI